MSEMTYEGALAHFGVMGMKWGRHKAPDTRSRAERINAAGVKATRVVTAAHFALVGGVLVAAALQTAANHAVAAKVASNGAKAAANLFADKNGIANHKLIDLGWDAVTGSWK